jgi:antitoxin VapB
VSLNIKSDEAHRLVRELALITGESQTAAVTEAVRDKLIRLRRAAQPSLSDRLIEIGRECATRLTDADRSLDIDEILYRPDGLPR